MSSGSFKNNFAYKLFTCKSYIYIYIYIYIYTHTHTHTEDLALNNPQGLMYHETQPNRFY